MNTSDIFITDVNTLTADQIKWKIVTSAIGTGSARFSVHRACPYVTKNGRDSPLIIVTDKVFTYGVKENSNESMGKTGFNYSIPLAIYDLNAPTEHQKKFAEACDIISKSGREFLLKNQAALGKDWIEADLRKLSVLWVGKDSKRPTLYAKMPMNKEGTEFLCDFVQPIRKAGRVEKKIVNPLLLRDVRCHVKAAVKIESIFVGSKQSFQTKVHEVIVFPAPKKVSLLTIDEADMEGLDEETDSDASGSGGEDELKNEETSQDQDQEAEEQPISNSAIEQFSIQTAVEEPKEEEKPRPRRGRKPAVKN